MAPLDQEMAMDMAKEQALRAFRQMDVMERKEAVEWIKQEMAMDMAKEQAVMSPVASDSVSTKASPVAVEIVPPKDASMSDFLHSPPHAFKVLVPVKQRVGQAVPVDWSTLSRKDLEKLAKAFSIGVGGNRGKLIERLKKAKGETFFSVWISARADIVRLKAIQCEDEKRRAYKKLLLKYHPDKNRHNREVMTRVYQEVFG